MASYLQASPRSLADQSIVDGRAVNFTAGEPCLPISSVSQVDRDNYGSCFTANDTQLAAGDTTLLSVTTPPLTSRQSTCAFLMVFVSFNVSLCYSLIVPFFPEEAARRGASEWETGFILAIYELASLLSSSLYGKHLAVIGSKFLYVTGVTCMGCCSILFGSLVYGPPERTFIVLCLLVRAFQGMSGSATQTSLFAITASEFPEKVGTMVGIYESSGGLAFIVGPVIGGMLYEVGGFSLPLYVVGASTICAAALCYVLLPSEVGHKVSEARNDITNSNSYVDLLKIPGTWLSMLSILAIMSSLSFMDLTIAIFLDKFGLKPTQKGFMFVILSLLYAVTTPLCGKLCDRIGCTKPLMMYGAFVDSCGFLLLGPSPLLHMKSSLWLTGIALMVIGFGMASQIIPPFKDMLQLAKQHGFPDDMHTNGLVSGVINTCFPLGSFIGPVVGGFLVHSLKFPWTTTILAFMNAALGTVIFLSIAGTGTALWTWFLRWKGTSSYTLLHDEQPTVNH